MAKKITAYCVQTKTKNVEMINPVINKNGNKYTAKGTDKKGNVMYAFMSKDSAMDYIKSGVAKKGKGF